MEETTSRLRGRFSDSSDTFSPYAEELKERGYTKPKVEMGNGDISDIPEPNIKNTTVNLNDNSDIPKFGEEKGNNKDSGSDKSSGGSSSSSSSSSMPLSDGGNPALNELTPKEKLKSCEQTVDFGLHAYGLLNKGAHKLFVEKNDKNIMEMEADGVDMSYPIKLANGQELLMGEFLMSYNENTEKILTVSEDFIGQVRDPLIRIAMKRNWAMTDENLVIGAFIGDIGMKAYSIFTLNQSLNIIGNAIKEKTMPADVQSSSVNGQNSQYTPPPPPSPPQNNTEQYTPPPPPPAPSDDYGQNHGTPYNHPAYKGEDIIPNQQLREEPTNTVRKPYEEVPISTPPLENNHPPHEEIKDRFSSVTDFVEINENNFSKKPDSNEKPLNDEEVVYAKAEIVPLPPKEHKKRGRKPNSEKIVEFKEPEEEKNNE